MDQRIRRLAKNLIPKAWWPQFVGQAVACRYFLFWFRYRGEAVECPFCGRRFARFLPDRLDIPVLKELQVVGGGFESSSCPRCHSTFRERLVYLYLKNKTSLFQDRLRLLHVAPDRNLRKVLRALPNLDYVSVDLDSPFAMLRMDITDIQFADASFDVIIGNHVLEHVPDDRKAMKELQRVLAPGGWAVLQVPISLALETTYEDPALTSPREREAKFGQDDHVRIYARDYRDRLEEAGFAVEIYNFSEEFGQALARRYGLQEAESVYVDTKPTRTPST